MGSGPPVGDLDGGGQLVHRQAVAADLEDLAALRAIGDSANDHLRDIDG